MRSPRRRLPRGCAGCGADSSDGGEERGGDGGYAAAEAGGAAESPRAEGDAEAGPWLISPLERIKLTNGAMLFMVMLKRKFCSVLLGYLDLFLPHSYEFVLQFQGNPT